MIQTQWTVMSGGALEAQGQFSMELKALPSEERQKLLREAGVAVEIDATQALVIKADLSIPWYRLRILRRLITMVHCYAQNTYTHV